MADLPMYFRPSSDVGLAMVEYAMLGQEVRPNGNAKMSWV